MGQLRVLLLALFLIEEPRLTEQPPFGTLFAMPEGKASVVRQALALRVLISVALASRMATPNFQEAGRSILPPT